MLVFMLFILVLGFKFYSEITTGNKILKTLVKPSNFSCLQKSKLDHCCSITIVSQPIHVLKIAVIKLLSEVLVAVFRGLSRPCFLDI